MVFNIFGLEIEELRQKLTEAIDKKELCRKILKESLGATNVDVLFLNISKISFGDFTQKLDIPVKFLNDKSILGKVFLNQNIFFTANVKNEDAYNIAIDNPFNIKLKQQIIIPIIGNNRVEGFIRFSGTTFDERSLPAVSSDLKKLNHVFREMYLYSFNKKMSNVQSSPFGENSHNIYTIINNIRDSFENLKKNAQHPEVQKLVDKGIVNIDTISEYSNPNLENVSRIKKVMLSIDDKASKTDHKARVLLVDDIFLNIKILNAMLVYDWIEEISHASDGLESIEKIESSINKNQRIDILFLDHHMPGMMGVEVAEYLREKAQKSSSYKVIVISITNDPDAIADKQNLYDYHLSKPFTRIDLDAIMQEIKRKYFNTTNTETLKK